MDEANLHYFRRGLLLHQLPVMGLAGNKKRSKLSTDPNNNAWAKSTNNFGHRILASQGWKPGDYLGAENAAHSDHYTAANASHIRVLLREDNLGLGAKVGGKSNAETFGLSTLSGIFGRLNGASDEDVQKKQDALRDAELRSYQDVKYGFINFVRGGLLVGDKIEDAQEKKLPQKTADAKMATADDSAKNGQKRKADDVEEGGKESSKKRKAGKGDAGASEAASEAKEKKQRKKERKYAEEESKAKDSEFTEEASNSSDSSADARAAKRQAKRERKERRRADREERRSEKNEDSDGKSRMKEDKRARKEERRRRKEEKRRARAEKSDTAAPDTTTTTTVATPATSGTSTPTQPAFGRQAIRQRYIQQKRMASMDPKALNEILMIKAQA